MGAEIRSQFDADVELIAGGGGVFEITLNGRLLYSKKKLGRFPEAGEVVNLLKKQG
ncbi:MAG: SelT/SelW/SelH family protein [Desulfobulbaceae bacterium]|nr:MAG: SelT/SelW/SelH family protein [Desulfobulbaceae bacterium]